jgi:signal transduction histidine kinase
MEHHVIDDPPGTGAPSAGDRPGAPDADVESWMRTADEARRRLDAFDAATVAISQELSLERVLQLIVGSVRPLARARYAALGILDDAGRLERFITSGISEEQRREIGDEPQGRGLLGVVIRAGEAIRVSDIARDERSVGFPPRHPPMTTFLGVPVRVEGRAIGRLYLTDRDDGLPFDEDDQQLVESFARHAGLAIHNARMHEELRQLAVLKERERISQDLHDGSIQSLYAVSLALEDAEGLVATEPNEAVERIERAIDDIHHTIREIREFITGLDGTASSSTDLSAGLEDLLGEFERSTMVPTRLVGETDVVLDPEAVTQLIRLTREALSNVARHAEASAVEVAVERRPGFLGLSIIDDGHGFDTSALRRSGHHGLTNMRARAESLGGSLNIHSDARGTQMRFEMADVEERTLERGS